MKKAALLYILMLFISSYSSATRMCSEAFFHLKYRFEDPRLKLIDRQERGIENDSNSIFLGEGATAQVFLTLTPNNQPIVKKVYRGTTYEVGRTDSKRLSALKELQLAGATLGFQIPTHKLYQVQEQSGIHNYIILLPYVKGRTVHDLLTDSQLSTTLRQSIREIFNKKVMRLAQTLASHTPQIQINKLTDQDLLYFRDRKNDDTLILQFKLNDLTFIIKSDNIIVDPYHLQMTLIDPI